MDPQSYTRGNNSQNPFSALLSGFSAPSINLSSFTKPLTATGVGTSGAPMSPAPNYQGATSYSRSPIQVSSSGGISFPAAPTVSASPTTPVNTPGVNSAPAAPVASQNGTYQLPNGGSISLDASGNPTNYTPGQSFTIGSSTGSSVPSSALSSGYTVNDLLQQRNSYADYVQGLATASQYSPEYLDAYQRSKNLEIAMANLRGNLATGAVPGDTQSYAEGFTNRALMGAGAQKAYADVGLATEELRRQGNIAGAEALVKAYEPQSVSPGSSLVSPVTGDTTYGGAGAYSDYQAQQTYFNLQQNYPDAQIPPYDTRQSPQQNLQIAQSAAERSPSFQSKNTISVPLPGGGYALVNKNQVGTKADGTMVIISPEQATMANSASKAVQDLTGQLANTRRAINTVESNFPLLLSIVKKAGVNDFNAPIANKLEQALNNRLIGSGDMASFNALVTSLQTEYAQILSRGGSVTDKARGEAEQLINGTIGYNALKDLYQTLQAESGNVVNGYTNEINTQNQALQGIYNSGQPLNFNSSNTGGGGTGGYITPAQASW